MADPDIMQMALEAAKDAKAAAEAAAAAAKAAKAQDPSLWDVVTTLPAVLLGFLAVALIIVNFPAISRKVKNITSFEAGGAKLTFAATGELGKAVRQGDSGAAVRLRKTYVDGDQGPNERVRITSDDQTRVLKRAKAAASVMEGRHILWADDRPANNLHEIKVMKACGLEVTEVRTNAEALTALAAGDQEYHVVISDIGRPEGEPAGDALAKDLVDNGIDVPVVYYITVLDPARQLPVGAFGLTNRPDELLHYVIDALERIRPLG